MKLHTLSHTSLFRLALEMQFDNSHLRFYIYTRCQLGESAVKIHHDLMQVWADAAPSYRSIADTTHQFKGGREPFSDFQRPGRPILSTNDEHCALVKSLLDENRHITMSEIAAKTGISTERVHFILHKKLAMRKICSRWVPHRLSPEQMLSRVNTSKEMIRILKGKCRHRNRHLENTITGDETWMKLYQVPCKSDNKVWMAVDEERPSVPRTAQGAKKHMFVIFFSCSGRILQCVVPHGQTVTGHWYQTNCIEPLSAKMQQSSSSSHSCTCSFFHHDHHLSTMTTLLRTLPTLCKMPSKKPASQ